MIIFLNHGRHGKKRENTENGRIFEPQIKADERRITQMAMLRFETLKEAE